MIEKTIESTSINKTQKYTNVRIETKVNIPF